MKNKQCQGEEMKTSTQDPAGRIVIREPATNVRAKILRSPWIDVNTLILYAGMQA
jgi:hypothetical protein